LLIWKRAAGEGALEPAGFEVTILMPLRSNPTRLFVARNLCAGLALAAAVPQPALAADEAIKPFNFPIVANIGGKCGFIGRNGEITIAAKYDRADQFGSFDLAKVRVGGKYGFIDKSGKVVIPIIHDTAGDFGKAGLIKLKLDEKEWVADHRGKELFVVPEGAFMGDFDDSDITAYTPPESDKTGFADRNGKMILPPIWDFAFGFGDGAIAPVELEGKWGFIDRSGKVVADPVYDFAGPPYLGSATVTLNEVDSEVDNITGQLLPKLTTADGYIVDKFNVYGLAYAYKELTPTKAKYGMVDKSMRWIAPPIYDYLYVDDDGLQYPAKLKGKAGYIDRQGQFTANPNYTHSGGFDGTEFAIASKGRKDGLIDRQGNWVLPPKFKALGYCKPPEPPTLIPPPTIEMPVPNVGGPPTVQSDK
jgi:hypothetical protein